jgi:hypothetical protein
MLFLVKEIRPRCVICARLCGQAHIPPSTTFSKCDTFFTSSVFYNKGLETSVCVDRHSGEDKGVPGV